jgi:hypothetical protein
MSRTISDQQWAAARAVSEGLSATHERIAGIMGVHTTTVSHRAAEDGWKSIDFRHARLRRMQAQIVELSRRIRAGEELDTVDPTETEEAPGTAELQALAALEPWPDEPPADRIARIGAVLTKHTETILRKLEAGLPLEARQVAALERLVALCERIAAMAREQADKDRKKDDEEVAQAIRFMQYRTVYLARCEARRIAVDIIGLSQEEVDEKVPEPVWRDLEDFAATVD